MKILVLGVAMLFSGCAELPQAALNFSEGYTEAYNQYQANDAYWQLFRIRQDLDQIAHPILPP
jgi:hypothetical protein